MSIQVGDQLPEADLFHMTADGPQPINSKELFSGKKVVMFAVPGAFTPTCSAAHLPGYIERRADLEAAGVDDVVCISVNDVFVMDAWGKAQGAEGIHMIADGSGAFTQAIGQVLDLTDRGLGVRSQRYAMLVEDGKVSALDVDEGGKLDVSSADSMLARLR